MSHVDRAKILDSLERLGVTIGPLRQRDTAYLSARLEIELDRGGHVDGDDAELAELAALRARFDAASRVLSAYCMADPWRNGEIAAMAAARQHVRDYDPNFGNASLTPAAEGRYPDPSQQAAVRAASARTGLSAFVPIETLRSMSDEQVLAAEQLLREHVANLVAQGGGAAFSTIAGGVAR